MSVSADIAPRALTGIDLLVWLGQAKAGDVLEYHCGFLQLDRSSFTSVLSHQERQRLKQMASLAMRLSDRGLVHLVQRRIGVERFSYFAVARKNTCDLSQIL